MANNLDKPTMEAQAASVARLRECPDVIGDPALRAFVVRIMVRVEQLKEESKQAAASGEEATIINKVKVDLNGHRREKEGRST